MNKHLVIIGEPCCGIRDVKSGGSCIESGRDSVICWMPVEVDGLSGPCLRTRIQRLEYRVGANSSKLGNARRKQAACTRCLSLNRGIREPFFERRKDEHVKCAENCRNIVANPEQLYMIADSKGGDSGTDVRLVFAASHEHELC